MQPGHLKDDPVLPLPRLTLAAALLAPLWAALPAQAQPAPVLTTLPEPASVAETVLLHGSVTTPQRATLAAPVAGLVAEVLVEAGDRVEAGAPLLQLDRELARLALQAQSAALDEARAELAEARRLVAQGAVQVDGERVSDAALRLPAGGPYLVKAGKRKFARIRVI